MEGAQKKAAAAEAELSSVQSQLDAQKQKVDQLTRDLSNAQQAKEKAEKALQQYLGAATSAFKQFQALRGTLAGPTPDLAVYQQKFSATQPAVTKLVNALPDAKVRRAIAGVLATCQQINDTCATAAQQMAARTQTARTNYDKYIEFGGLGPNRYVIEIGKDKILAPAEKANAATASARDRQVVTLEKDFDQGLKNLQAFVNASGA